MSTQECNSGWHKTSINEAQFLPYLWVGKVIILYLSYKKKKKSLGSSVGP